VGIFESKDLKKNIVPQVVESVIEFLEIRDSTLILFLFFVA
jgi:hypothetical protein